MSIRTLIVDDQALIREALKALLSYEQGIEVVGEAANGSVAVEQFSLLQPDVVLMDILMPVMDGVEATKIIQERFPDSKILILSIDGDGEYVCQAMKCGAAGYILKNTPGAELVLAIQSVYRGYTHLGPGLGQKLLSQIPEVSLVCRESWQKLTNREKEIVKLIAGGASNREIAQTLYITERTVKNHISNILGRLHLRDRTQIAILAHSNCQLDLR